MKKSRIFPLFALAWTATVAEPEPIDRYVAEFNAADFGRQGNVITNAAALAFLRENVPLFECPDKTIERKYYFRWWVFRKHLKVTKSGDRVITEFLPGVFWAGPENTISCPLGHHIREGRWLGDGSWARDYLDFMIKKGCVTGRGAYVNWPALNALELEAVTGDRAATDAWLDVLVAHYRTWETTVVPTWGPGNGFFNGMFCVLGGSEGMEAGPAASVFGERPIINCAFSASARAISEIARRRGLMPLADEFKAKSLALDQGVRTNLWNADIAFFACRSYRGVRSSVRELHGYAPWYFDLAAVEGRDEAWRNVVDTNRFAATYGLCCTERCAKDFKIDYHGHECQWNGPVWPYVTSMTLTALANYLQKGGTAVTVEDYCRLLHQYAASMTRQLEDGSSVDWIDENLNPFTGDWISRTVLIRRAEKRGEKYTWERGKDYNHSSFCDLVISGLCGIIPKVDGPFEVKPLVPASWDYFSLRNLRYHGKRYNVYFDRDGRRFGKGKGITVEVQRPESVDGRSPK